MTIPTHVRVERGYFRRRYDERKEQLRPQASERFRCRYRHGWAKWLEAELIAYWHAEATGASLSQLESMLSCQPTSDQWMSFASSGRAKRLIGKNGRRILSIG